MKKRYYILFVARNAEGELRKIPIPLHYAYVFLVGAVIGMFTITGMAGSYTRMLMKVMQFNEVRAEKEALRVQYGKLEQEKKEKEIQVASLGSLASEVTTLYGLREPALAKAASVEYSNEQAAVSLDQLYALRNTALNGGASLGIGMGTRNASLTDWAKLVSMPTLWPVTGRLTSSFGERIDPFRGEGAFHTGVDISTDYGHPVIAPADGTVRYADLQSGYGRLIVIEHQNGISTRYGHLSAMAVTPGQRVMRGDVIGFVGLSGRTTSPHLHYEVRIHETPVNPYKYLRTQPTMLAANNAD